jgi:hypothetical protein
MFAPLTCQWATPGTNTQPKIKKTQKIFERKQDLQDEAVLPVEVQIEIVKGFRVGTVHFVDSLAHLFVPQIIKRRKKTKINRREFGSTAIKKANKIKNLHKFFHVCVTRLKLTLVS